MYTFFGHISTVDRQTNYFLQMNSKGGKKNQADEIKTEERQMYQHKEKNFTKTTKKRASPI